MDTLGCLATNARLRTSSRIAPSLPNLCLRISADSDQPSARLIGIEYIISERLLKTLPEEEKRFWHSHK